MSSVLNEAISLAESLARERGRKGLLNFTVQTKEDFAVTDHHRTICRALNGVIANHTPRQIMRSMGHTDAQIDDMAANQNPATKLYAGCTNPDILDKPVEGFQLHMPPRHGKTELAGRRVAAYHLGIHPNKRLLYTSYGAELASMANRDVQRILEHEAYQSMFPHTRLNASNVRAVGSWMRNSDYFEVVGHRGSFRNAGVGGPLTGFGCDGLAIVDDPFKNRHEAESPVNRANVWSWYTSTLYTRLEQGAKKILTNTRWHEMDLSGATLKNARNDPTADQWFCLVLPAILDQPAGPGDFRAQGEALWPSRYPLSRLNAIRSTIGPYEWNALFQQRPSPGDGGVIKSSWWQFYDHVPQDLEDIVVSADLTFGDRGDFAVFQVWGCKGSQRYLIEERRDRMGFTGQLATTMALAERYPHARAFLIEKSANAEALISVLTDRIPAMLPIRPHGSKSLRIDAVSPQIQAGNVFLPSPSLAPWVEEWIEEFKNFPNGAHDDRIDACSQALNYLRGDEAIYGELIFPDLEKDNGLLI